MAYVDKARVEGTLYDISPSPTGNLDSTSENAYTSSDVAQANATTWTNVDPILNTEQHRSIFSKVTGMIKNIRYLYNLVGSGTFAPGNGTTITDVVNNKAPKSHNHTAAQLPTSNSQINSTSYVPTSALIYSMNQTLNSLNDAISDIESGTSSMYNYWTTYHRNTVTASFSMTITLPAAPEFLVIIGDTYHLYKLPCGTENEGLYLSYILSGKKLTLIPGELITGASQVTVQSWIYIWY